MDDQRTNWFRSRLGEEQVSELPVVRPRLQEIEEVERNRVAGDVVVAYDF